MYIDFDFKKVAGIDFDPIISAYQNTKSCFFNIQNIEQQKSQRLQDLSYAQRQLIIHTNNATYSNSDFNIINEDFKALVTSKKVNFLPHTWAYSLI